MTSDPIHLQKLPGHRRGVIKGASAFLAPDHILLVRSHRFSEEYKRYYLHDIQAIVLAHASRYHISSRALFVLAVWTIAMLVSFRVPWLPWLVWPSAIVLVGAWVEVSVNRSCICRIYTAVSSDPLPSVYRTWTARKFLEIVEPRIRAVQGELDPGWMEAVEQRPVGPEVVRDFVRANPSSMTDPAFAAETPAVHAGSSRTLASDLFLVAMLLQAGVDVFAFSNRSSVLTWTVAGLVLAQIVAAVFLFVDRNRGRLHSSIHKVAIAKLLWVSLMFYISTFVLARGGTPGNIVLQLAPVNDIVRGVDVVVTVALLAAGLLLTYRPEPDRPTTIFGS